MCQARGLHLQEPRASSGVCQEDWIPASTSPSKSESERQEHRKLCSELSPHGAPEAQKGHVSSEPAVSAPRLLNGPQGRPAALSDAPLRPHPTACLGSCSSCAPSGVLQGIYRDVYALSRGDLSRGTGVFGPGPLPSAV